MNNPYSAPKSSVSVAPTAEQFVEGIYVRKKVVPALAILLAVEISFAWIPISGDVNGGALYAISSSIFAAISLPYALYVLHRMANGKLVRAVPRYYGIWGLIWRAYLVQFLSLVGFAGAYWAFRHTSEPMQASVATNVACTVAALILSPAVVWLLFSKDRRNQLYWVSRLLGGG